MTIETCKKLCLGFTYAGVQYSEECFCGNTAPTITAQNCDMECAGNAKQICGGVWAMNVYSTKTKAYSCEHSSQAPGNKMASLTCDHGYIQVNKAIYGKPNPNVCVQNSTKQNVCPFPKDHTDRVKAECDGEKTCTYHGNNEGEGDPCYGVHKHTEIEYSCVTSSDDVYSCEHRRQGQTKAKLRCSDGKTIKTQFATYGSPVNNICPSKATFGNKDKTCAATIDHTSAVASACDGKEACEYHGNNSLGDPCPYVEKFTHINYLCEFAVPKPIDIVGYPTIDGKFSFSDDTISMGRSEYDHVKELSEYDYVEHKLCNEGDICNITISAVGNNPGGGIIRNILCEQFCSIPIFDWRSNDNPKGTGDHEWFK